MSVELSLGSHYLSQSLDYPTHTSWEEAILTVSPRSRSSIACLSCDSNASDCPYSAMPDKSIARVPSSADLSLGSTVIPMRFQTSDGTSPEIRIVVCIDGLGWSDGGGRAGFGPGGTGGIGGAGFGWGLGCSSRARRRQQVHVGLELRLFQCLVPYTIILPIGSQTGR